MNDAFRPHEKNFQKWKEDGYPNIKSKTREYLEHLFEIDREINMWDHQKEGFLRLVYAYEILGMNNFLLNIVTGGGKTAIIAAAIFWLKSIHGINKFLILTPNTIVRARLEVDFKKDHNNIFQKFEMATDAQQQYLHGLTLHVMEPGKPVEGMLDSGIMLGNIQQLYQAHSSGIENLTYIKNFVGKLAIFNDEAHNTPADEYTQILSSLSDQCLIRLDTTATPERADGNEPDSQMIYHYDIKNALDDNIIKSIVVYKPDVKAVELTYTNPETKVRKKITELDAEFKAMEKSLTAPQWILDEDPMRKQIKLAVDRHNEQKIASKSKYKPILFVVTLSIKEGKRVRDMLETRFGLNTLLVTEQSDEEDRADALQIGSFESNYEAIVSVLMLREGWDVPEVSTILLLRKFSSPVYGQQVIGRGLRKIVKHPKNREVLNVIDHPILKHDWLWGLLRASKIRTGVTDDDVFIPDEGLPEHLVQYLANPDNRIIIPDPSFTTNIPFEKYNDEIPLDTIDDNWEKILNDVSYNKSMLELTDVEIRNIEKTILDKNRIEVEPGIRSDDFIVNADLPNTDLAKHCNNIILNACRERLDEMGYSNGQIGELYESMLHHVKTKIFLDKPTSEIDKSQFFFVIRHVDKIKDNFTDSLIRGILKNQND